MPSKKEIEQMHAHHVELIDEFTEQLRFIFDSSEQPMYLYLDDNHKSCNEKFATLLGMKSPKEWSDAQENVLETFVADKSQKVLQTAYFAAMEKMIGSTIQVTWKKKSGGTVDSTVILVPTTYQGHLFALHFITPKS